MNKETWIKAILETVEKLEKERKEGEVDSDYG